MGMHRLWLADNNDLSKFPREHKAYAALFNMYELDFSIFKLDQPSIGNCFGRTTRAQVPEQVRDLLKDVCRHKRRKTIAEDEVTPLTGSTDFPG